jgi:hypothetical protein
LGREDSENCPGADPFAGCDRPEDRAPSSHNAAAPVVVLVHAGAAALDPAGAGGAALWLPLRVLVLDSAENTNSTAAALLAPFGLRLEPHPQPAGTLTTGAGFPAIPVQAALQVTGGTAFCRLHERTVGATVQHGRGTVTVLGIGARFTDIRMGVTGDVEPDAALRSVYEFQFRLLRRLIEGPWPPAGEEQSGSASGLPARAQERAPWAAARPGRKRRATWFFGLCGGRGRG